MLGTVPAPVLSLIVFAAILRLTSVNQVWITVSHLPGEQLGARLRTVDSSICLCVKYPTVMCLDNVLFLKLISDGQKLKVW